MEAHTMGQFPKSPKTWEGWEEPEPSPVLVEGMHSGSTEGGEKPGLRVASSP